MMTGEAPHPWNLQLLSHWVASMTEQDDIGFKEWWEGAELIQASVGKKMEEADNFFRKELKSPAEKYVQLTYQEASMTYQLVTAMRGKLLYTEAVISLQQRLAANHDMMVSDCEVVLEEYKTKVQELSK
jgi:hypothetical protein